MIIRSIWQDTILQVTDSVFDYEVYVDTDTLIFKGRAYKRPGADYTEIKVNKICENYVSNSLQAMVEDASLTSSVNANAYREFTIKDLDGNTIEEYAFLYDWSYEQKYSGGAKNLSAPINGRYTDGMWRMGTNITASGLVSNNKGAAGNYPTRVECGEWALYYLGYKGGWDALLIEGNVLKKSTITQYTTDKTFNNQKPQFELNRYVSEIQYAYELNTGFLTDEQAALLCKSLIPSNEVYLHNLVTGEIIPVVITDTQAIQQTYATNNLQLPQYKINVKESQTKIRR